MITYFYFGVIDMNDFRIYLFGWRSVCPRSANDYCIRRGNSCNYVYVDRVVSSLLSS